MLAILFLILAILFQIGASIQAFRLISVTGRATAWILISAAYILMAVRRVIPLGRALGGFTQNIDPINELIGMVLSMCMFLGVLLIGPIFKKIFEAARALAESERRFRSYFELPIVGFATMSPDLHILSANERLCSIFGYSSVELIGRKLSEFGTPEELERETVQVSEINAGKAEGFTLDKRFDRNGSATPVWISQAARCVRAPDGSVASFVVVIQEITERKLLEENLRGLVSEKEVLLRELYHRTRNNMQVICSFLNLECSKYLDPSISEAFKIIENRILSIALVHDKLYEAVDFSHIDLSDYLRDLAELIVNSYPTRSGGVRLSTNLDCVPVNLETAVPCGLILDELLTNCLKHAFPPGYGGHISIELRKDLPGVRLVVADDGPLIPGDFDFRASAGLGLKEAFVLAEQIKGDLQFIVRGGVRCTFTFPN